MKKKKDPAADAPLSIKTKCKIRAYRDFIFLRVKTEAKVNGIIIPESAQDVEHPVEGVIVAVGDGLVEGGVVVPLTARIGDHVHMPRHVGTFIKIKETDETFFVCRENILFGAVEVPE